MVLWKCWLALWRCGGSSAQVGSFLWAAMNNVVRWLFSAKKLENISRNVTGEKGLGAQISRSCCTHFWKYFFSLLSFQSNTVCVSLCFFSPFCRKWLCSNISKTPSPIPKLSTELNKWYLTVRCTLHTAHFLSDWILFVYIPFPANRTSHWWGIGAQKDGMKYFSWVSLLNWQNDIHHPDV